MFNKNMISLYIIKQNHIFIMINEGEKVKQWKYDFTVQFEQENHISIKRVLLE